jgi:enamine deaminase RidA (YjgF/YER057c/UK114 family)
MISLAERLRSRGLTLPKPTPPNGTYEPFTRSGSIIFMAGTTCVRDGHTWSRSVGRRRTESGNGFVKCLPDFTEQPRVLDGASEIFLLALGDRGRHARAAVSAYALPRGATVEIEATFEIG